MLAKFPPILITFPSLSSSSSLTVADPLNEALKSTLDLGILKRVCQRNKRKGWASLKLKGISNPRFRAFWIAGGKNEHDTIVVFSKPSASDFMGYLPDDTELGSITLAGTHESCALYGFPISQCQQPSTSIARQLLDGVRFLDVRLRVVGDELLMYHGPRPQRSNLKTLLSVLHDFLTSHPTETFILSIKQETPPFHPHFSKIVYDIIKPFLEKFWFVAERIPLLGEVRGKGILLSRFDRNGDGEEGGWGEGLGIHPYTWPDSRREGFEWFCKDVTVRTQDWYRVKTFFEIPDKFEAITTHLQPTSLPAQQPSRQSLTFSFLSASYFPLSLPTIIAKGFGFPRWGLGVEGINSRFCLWLLDKISRGERIRACVIMDFYRQCGGVEGELVDLLIMMNFS